MALSEQEIHVMVEVLPSNFEFICTAVYASPRFHKRCVLWNNFKNAASLHDKPWVIVGDFNEVLLEGDKYGGRSISSSRSLLFKECLDYCSMVDMGFVGPRFTWTNKRNFSALVEERINRFFANPSWYALHPDTRVTHLTRCVSDHCLILLDTNPSNRVFLPRPFKFQNFWLSDLSFPGFVREAWGRARTPRESVESFSRKATNWNKNHFGNIFGKKKRVTARLNGIQKAIANHLSHSLLELEKVLHKELNTLLDQEEELWVQKSRINQLIESDSNTSFHHMSTIVRRRHNKISCIKNDMREWILSENGAMNHIRRGFEKLFTTSLDLATLNPMRPHWWLNSLFDEERSSLGGMVTDAEIKDGIWALKTFKVPSPDGLHASFFQRFWLIVGDSVKEGEGGSAESVYRLQNA